MEITVKWMPQALKGLDKVILYLEEEWTENEIIKLEENINNFINRLKENPKIHPLTKKYKDTYKGLVDTNNYIVYRIKPKKKLIEIINFRGTKQKPLY